MRAPTVFLTGILTFCASADPGAAVQVEGAAGAEGYELEASEQVRVTPVAGGDRTVGHVLRATDDSLVLELRASPVQRRSEVAFAWGEVRDVERSVGREDHRGWVAGLSGGASIWVLTNPGEEAPYLALLSSSMALGIASLYRPHRWEALPRKPAVGERVRVDRTIVGSLVAVSGDALVLDPEGEAESRRTIARERVVTLERSLGSRRYMARGALYGTALGLGMMLGDPPYTLAGPPLGALLGLGVGALIERERWGEAVVP